MQIKVRFFARYREIVGHRETEIEMPPGATPLQAWERFASSHPDLSPHLSYTRFALNGQYVSPDSPMKDGDEVAFIPPVSGGSRV